MVSKGRIAVISAITIFSLINPYFEAVNSLFKNSENRSIVSEAFAKPRKSEKSFRVKVKNRIYTLEESGSDNFTVSDSLGNIVLDGDTAQKAIFSQLVYDGYITKLSDLPWKPIYSLYFKLGERIQSKKGTLGDLIFQNYKLMEAGVKGAKLGPHGTLLAILGELGKERIINLGKKIIKHPEVVYAEIAEKFYKEGREAWNENISIERKVRQNGFLSYEDADRFLYNWFLAETLMPASNNLTNDVVDVKRKNKSIGKNNTAKHFLGYLNTASFLSKNKKDLLATMKMSVNNSLNPFSGAYKRFSNSVREGLEGYIKKKIEFDERAVGSIGQIKFAKRENKLRKHRILDNESKVTFHMKRGQEDIYLANISKREVIQLTNDRFRDRDPALSYSR